MKIGNAIEELVLTISFSFICLFIFRALNNKLGKSKIYYTMSAQSNLLEFERDKNEGAHENLSGTNQSSIENDITILDEHSDSSEIKSVEPFRMLGNTEESAKEKLTVKKEEPITVIEHSESPALEKLSGSNSLNGTQPALHSTKADKTIQPERKNVIVSREWMTEMNENNCELTINISTIPEKDTVFWQIKDFDAFRSASKFSKIPPLCSPAFGGGCYVKLILCDSKGHIAGRVELPASKRMKEGIAHIQVTVLKPDLKPITKQKLEIRCKALMTNADSKQKSLQNTFILTKKKLFQKPNVSKYVTDDSLRLRIEFQYFPFDSAIFRGLERKGCGEKDYPKSCSVIEHGNSEKDSIFSGSGHFTNLLADIQRYCEENTSEYIDIKTDESSFKACRFLISARSTKFNEILHSSNNPHHSARSGNRGTNSSLASITVKDLSAGALEQMLMFIHTDTCSWLEDHTTDLMNVLELVEAADSYGVESLEKSLVEHLASRLDRDNFVLMYEASERCTNPMFKTLCMTYMDSLPGSQVATIMRASSNFGYAETPRLIHAESK